MLTNHPKTVLLNPCYHFIQTELLAEMMHCHSYLPLDQSDLQLLQAEVHLLQMHTEELLLTLQTHTEEPNYQEKQSAVPIGSGMAKN